MLGEFPNSNKRKRAKLIVAETSHHPDISMKKPDLFIHRRLREVEVLRRREGDPEPTGNM